MARNKKHNINQETIPVYQSLNLRDCPGDRYILYCK